MCVCVKIQHHKKCCLHFPYKAQILHNNITIPLFDFSYGHLTWEWTQGIRSYFYPTLFAILYKVLDVLKIDSRILLILLPRIFQAIISAYADYRFYNWCNRKKWALFIVATSWFWFYTGSRTLINTFEAALTTIALSFFPWSDYNGKLRTFLVNFMKLFKYLFHNFRKYRIFMDNSFACIHSANINNNLDAVVCVSYKEIKVSHFGAPC